MPRRPPRSILRHLDPFTLILLAALLAAFLVPASGRVYDAFSVLAKLVVAGLFFLHGAKLSPADLKDGLANYRLQLLILLSTFALFPLAALALRWPLGLILPPGLVMGFVFLACLPSTVQSSIAFTSMARGNVAAAVCAASASSLLGVIVTPFLVGILIRSGAASPLLPTLRDLFLQLVAPFALGQFLRARLKGFLGRHKRLTGVTDRLSVVFIVFVSFSHATNTGLWATLDLAMLPGLILGSLLLLGVALAFTWKAGGALGFPYPDRVAILFCGSKKSLMTGVPMANVIFPPGMASLLIIPLMLFHQLQLIACAIIAKALGGRDALGRDAGDPDAGGGVTGGGLRRGG